MWKEGLLWDKQRTKMCRDNLFSLKFLVAVMQREKEVEIICRALAIFLVVLVLSIRRTLLLELACRVSFFF